MSEIQELLKTGQAIRERAAVHQSEAEFRADEPAIDAAWLRFEGDVKAALPTEEDGRQFMAHDDGETPENYSCADQVTCVEYMDRRLARLTEMLADES